MLLTVTGAGGAGKSTVLSALARTVWERPVRCVEFDSIGVPPGADTAWRHAAVENWIQQAIDEQDNGRHLVLCGQVPICELLALTLLANADGDLVDHNEFYIYTGVKP